MTNNNGTGQRGGPVGGKDAEIEALLFERDRDREDHFRSVERR